MKIAIDYDDTFTAAPDIFKKVIKLFKQAGHEVIFVTIRFGGYPENIHQIANKDIEFHAKELGINIIYTDGRQKEHLYDADIWIDHSPITISCYDDMVDMSNGCEVNNDTQKLY